MKPVKLTKRLSFVPFVIQLYFNDEILSTATAFFYSLLEKTYLITNWHNVAGRNIPDLSPKHLTGALPNNMALRLPVKILAGGTEAVGWVEKKLDLYEDPGVADPQTPVWWEHLHHGLKVDVVAIQIDGWETTATIPANDPSLDLDPLTISAGMDAFVLGYPRGISGGGWFPFWKRATIASEPDIDIDGLPMFYIDTATREGMSGAPVYAKGSGFSPVEGKQFPDGALVGTAHRFMGVYSGRMVGDEFEAQIGKVWKEEAIVEVISGKHVGQSSWNLTARTSASP